jgi:putative hemolysin
MDDPGWLHHIVLGLVAEPFNGTDWALLIVLLVALLLAGFSAAAETALTSVNRLRIRNDAEEGDASASRILRLIEKPERFLSAILVTSNVAVITASTVATILAINLFGDTGGVISTVVLSLIVLIFCEITPKTWAVQAPERRARIFIGPVEMLSRVLGPLVRVLMFLTNGIVRMFGGAPVKRGPFVTEDELRLLVEVGEQEGVLEEEEREMIHNVFELADTTVREVMVPRPDIITVEADATLDDAMKIIVEGGQSRIPVYADSIDDIIGVLYAKDLLRVLTFSERPPSVRSLVRQAYFVPESKRLDDLLREMQAQRVHMAIVVDEYGSVAGLATIEDLVEQIIGDIQDEYDREEQLVERIGDNEFIVDAKISLDELNELLDVELASEEYDTLGGLIYAKLDKIPSAGDTVMQGNLTFTVLGTKGRRVTKVRVVRATPGAPAERGAEPSPDDGLARPSNGAIGGDAGELATDHPGAIITPAPSVAEQEDEPGRSGPSNRASYAGYTSPPHFAPSPALPAELDDFPAEAPSGRQEAVSRPVRPRPTPYHRGQGRAGTPRRR